MSAQPVTITLTGAGGQIGYAAIFRIASGALLGPNQPVNLRLLEVEQGVSAAEGTALELTDCAFPNLNSVNITTDPAIAFDGANLAFLVGARPRSAGMERSDLLHANGRIFGPQGQAINEHAAADIRVVVVGNPANTNALIAQRHAPDVSAERFTALTRLDHNRAVGILAEKAGVAVAEISGVTIWGNHSGTQYPDLSHAIISDSPALDLVDPVWARSEYIHRVAERGAEVIATRGSSSAASAANAAIEHMRDWVAGTGQRWTSVALPSDGSYGIPHGIISSFPARSIAGEWAIVQGLTIDQFSRGRIETSVSELLEERSAVESLGLLPA